MALLLLQDARSVYIFIVTAIPLFIGSLIELREVRVFPEYLFLIEQPSHNSRSGKS